MAGKLAMAVAATWLFTGCAAGVVGNGVHGREVREVPAFEAVEVGYGIEAEVTAGEAASVTLEGDGNLLPLVETEVHDGRLSVGVKGAFAIFATVGLRVKVVTPKLDAVEASGGARVKVRAGEAARFVGGASGGAVLNVRGLRAEQVRATGSGGGRVSLEGTAGELIADFSGGAVLEGEELASELVRLDGSGGAHGTLLAICGVAGSLSGGAHFTVLGEPSYVRVETSGGAIIDHRN